MDVIDQSKTAKRSETNDNNDKRGTKYPCGPMISRPYFAAQWTVEWEGVLDWTRAKCVESTN